MSHHHCPACKQLLDGGRALERSIGCMSNSILLAQAGGGNDPDQALADEFQAKADELALLAAKIEKQVRGE